MKILQNVVGNQAVNGWHC